MTKELKTIEELKQRLMTINFEASEFAKKYETTLGPLSREQRIAESSLVSIRHGYQLPSKKHSFNGGVEWLTDKDFFDKMKRCLPHNAHNKETMNLEAYLLSLTVNNAFRVVLGPLLDKMREKIQAVDDKFQHDKGVVEAHLTRTPVTGSSDVLRNSDVVTKKSLAKSISLLSSKTSYFLNRGKIANAEREFASEQAKEKANDARKVTIEPYLAFVDRHRGEIKGHEHIMNQMLLLNTSEKNIKSAICHGLRETYQERQVQFENDYKELETSAKDKIAHEQTAKTLKGMRPIDVSHIDKMGVLIDALKRQASQIDTLAEQNMQYVKDDFVWQKAHVIIESPTLMQGVLTANTDPKVIASILSCAKKHAIQSRFIEDAVNGLKIETLSQAAVDGVLAFIKQGRGKENNFSKVESKLEFMSILLAKQDVDERDKIIKSINKPNVVEAVIHLSQLNLLSKITSTMVGEHADIVNFLSANGSTRNDIDEILSSREKSEPITVLMMALQSDVAIKPEMIKRFVSNVVKGNEAQILEVQEKILAMTQMNKSNLDKPVKQEVMLSIENNIMLARAINYIYEQSRSIKRGDESLLLALANEVTLSEKDENMASKICNHDNGEYYQNALVTLYQDYLNVEDDVLSSPLIGTLNSMPIDKMKQTGNMLNALNHAFEKAVGILANVNTYSCLS